MSFYNATYLALLLFVPIIIVIALLRQHARAKARNKFAPKELLARYSDLEPPSRPQTRSILYAIALALIIVAFARPQGGERVVEEEVEGIDIMVVMDISRSMLARDLHPNRLTAIKNVVNQLIESSYGDRIGVVAFAGDPLVVCPLTTDHGSVMMFVDQLTTDEDVRPGTGIGNAITLATNRFGDTEAGKVMILLTDGENNKGIEPMVAAEAAKEAGVRIYTVGIGTSEGAELPDEDQPVIGRTIYRTDEEGNPIMVGLDDTTLRDIARETGGLYFPALNQREVNTLYSRLSREGVVEFQSRRIVRRDELAPYFLLIAALFLIMEAFYSYITPSEVRHAKARA